MSFKVISKVALGLAMFSFAAPLLAEPMPRFSVMSFNTWYGCSRVDGGFEKAKAAILASKADLVGMQEASPELAQRMADALGWQRANIGSGSVQILSRHPVVETFCAADGIGEDRFIGAKIRINDEAGREVILGNIHLDFVHYGPYAARLDGATPASVLAENGKSARVAQMEAALRALRPWLAGADATPVVLTGDFNVPSHLDWTAATAAANGGVGAVAWPESRLVQEAGLVDSYRSLHPDPVAESGNTWSTVHKETEPQDRIDFIYFKGGSLVAESSATFTTGVETTVGAWGCDHAPVASNTWPSDHAAVLTTFRWKASDASP
ncbi:MAG: endonuclease/exonuclease/phosphatase family protein [Verrucomicrobiota bacterium]